MCGGGTDLCVQFQILGFCKNACAGNNFKMVKKYIKKLPPKKQQQQKTICMYLSLDCE